MGHVDAFCGVGRNEIREKEYIYSIRPLYHISNVVAMHRSDLFIPQSFDDIRTSGIKVATFLGTTSAAYLKMQPGIYVNDSFTDLMTGLRLVANEDRHRMFFYHDLGLVYLLQKSELPLHVVNTKFRTVSHWMLYSRKKSVETIQYMEEALLDVELSGELNEIRSRYTTGD